MVRGYHNLPYRSKSATLGAMSRAAEMVKLLGELYAGDPKPRSANHKANVLLNRAVKSGRVVPQPCEVCGRPPRAPGDLRRRVAGHHTDYCKPLDVRWLCDQCHAREHRNLRTWAPVLYKRKHNQ